MTKFVTILRRRCRERRLERVVEEVEARKRAVERIR